MEVISHLFYRVCVAQRPAEEQVSALRSWTGGPKARVPGQEVVYSNGTPLADPPLELEHVLQVLDWLFTEVEITYWPETPHDDAAAPRVLPHAPAVRERSAARGRALAHQAPPVRHAGSRVPVRQLDAGDGSPGPPPARARA